MFTSWRKRNKHGKMLNKLRRKWLYLRGKDKDRSPSFYKGRELFRVWVRRIQHYHNHLIQRS